MVAPRIDEKLYSSQDRQKAQEMLDKHYEGLEPLKSGKYSSSLEIEAAYLAEGFACAETFVLGNNAELENIVKGLEKMFGKENFRLAQPIPKRFATKENNSSFGFALYIRYAVPKETGKSQVTAIMGKRKFMPATEASAALVPKSETAPASENPASKPIALKLKTT